MRLVPALVFVLAAIAAIPAAAQDAPAYVQAGYDTDGQSVDSISVFFVPLARYGRWLDTRYGRAWAPSVGRDWRPYTIGHWEPGAYGPTWRSDEPFGWAVYHFGRWAYDPAIGWVWLPDTIWGPGWVAWRDGDDVTGWAPLPPQVDVYFSGGTGFNDWGYDQWYQPGWVYVPRYALYGRSLRRAYLPAGRGRDLWEHTHGVTHYDRVGGQVVNRSFGDGRGPDRDGGYGGDRRDGGRSDLRTTQTYAARPRDTAPSPDGDGSGFVPLPGGHGYGDGFIPGGPRGGERRGSSQPLAVRPGIPAVRAAPLAVPRVAPPIVPRAAPPPPRPAPRADEHHH